jgi:hypothetical protein
VAARERLIDDDDRGAVARVTLGKRTSGDDREIERREIPRSRRLEISERTVVPRDRRIADDRRRGLEGLPESSKVEVQSLEVS